MLFHKPFIMYFQYLRDWWSIINWYQLKYWTIILR